MAYTKQTFTAGQTLKASDLNTMSQGIVDKQDTLVSGTSIKTINGQSLLGSGNLEIQQGDSVVVDSALSETSENPIQNKAVTSALNNKQDKLTIDSALSASSTNPIQNVAVYSELAKKQKVLISGSTIKTINGQSLLGSGDLAVTGDGTIVSTGYMLPSPIDKASLAGKVIACVGDSITYGVNADPNYVQNLATELNCTTKNLGQSGTTLCEGGPRTCNIGKLTETNLSGADIVTILMGINDWAAANSDNYDLGEVGTDDTNTIYGAMKMWCDRIMELKNTEALANTKFYFMTPIITNWNSTGSRDWDQSKVGVHGFTLRRMCEAIIEVATAYEIPIIDLNLYSGIYYNSADDETTTQYGGDGVHPNTAGHAVMTQCIIRALTQNAEYKSEESAIYYLLDLASKKLGTELSYPISASHIDKVEPEQPSEPEAPVLTSISASYTGGNVAVGTAVSALTGISVTATYSDGTSNTVTGYTVSGTINEGNNTITVSYQGKTATFTVVGIANSEPVTLTGISVSYTGGDVVVGTSVNDLTGVSVTATYSDGTTSSVTGYTLSGNIAEGSNTITATYGGKTATFTVNGVVVEDVTSTATWDLGATVVNSDNTFTFTSGLASVHGPKNTAVCLVPIKPNMQVEIEVSQTNGSATGAAGKGIIIGLSSNNTVAGQLIANGFFVIPEANIYIEAWARIKGLGYVNPINHTMSPMTGSLKTGLTTVPVTFARSSDGNVSISLPDATSQANAKMFEQEAYLNAIKGDMFLVFQGDAGVQVKLSYIRGVR